MVQQRIAAELGVDQSTVSRGLARVHRRSLEDLDGTVRLRLITLVEQLDHVLDESLQAFERSKQPRKVASRTVADNPASFEEDPWNPDDAPGGTKKKIPPTLTTSTTQVEERDGNPAFINAFYAGTDRLRKLLNLDELTKPKAGADGAGDTPSVRDALAEALAVADAYEAETSPLPPRRDLPVKRPLGMFASLASTLVMLLLTLWVVATAVRTRARKPR